MGVTYVCSVCVCVCVGVGVGVCVCVCTYVCSVGVHVNCLHLIMYTFIRLYA